MIGLVERQAQTGPQAASLALEALDRLKPSDITGNPRLSSALGIVRTALRGAATVEILALRRRGAHVRHVGPDPEIAQVMGRNLMDPRPSERVLAGGYWQGRELAAAALRE